MGREHSFLLSQERELKAETNRQMIKINAFGKVFEKSKDLIDANLGLLDVCEVFTGV
jgi:hypothetical protein